MSRSDDGTAGRIPVIVGIVIVFIFGCMWAYPYYNVYSSRMDGEAQLAHAQSAKEVAVAEAKAKMESADMLAKAEVIRAEGVAKANTIIGDSLKGNDAYLRYLWIQNLESHGNETVIYIPTEAGLPILESARLNHPATAKVGK